MGKLLQYPLKQNTVTQCVMPDNTMSYCWVADYTRDGRTHSFHFWAADEEEALEILYCISQGARLRCKLSEFVEPQSRRTTYETPATDSVTDDDGLPPVA